MATIACAQDVVRLRTSATVPASGVVTLGDIATIEGSQADALRTIVLRERAEAGQHIGIDDVRAAMRGAGCAGWQRLVCANMNALSSCLQRKWM